MNEQIEIRSDVQVHSKAYGEGRKHRCPECGGYKFIKDYEREETTCMGCGVVIEDDGIDRGPEWRHSDDEQSMKRERVGPPLNYATHDKGLSTVIDHRDRDLYGRSIGPEQKAQMGRLRKYQRRYRLQSNEDRNLAQAMQELDRLADRLLTPPNVKGQAAVIYRKALKKGLIRGRSIEYTMAASLLAAYKVGRVRMTLKEVADASFARKIDISGTYWKRKNAIREEDARHAHKKSIGRTYRLLLNEFEMDMPIDDPLRCVSIIASKVGVDERVTQYTNRILYEAKKERLTAGKEPMGIAAAALYRANERLIESGLIGDRVLTKISQRAIAAAANVTEVTLRNRYKGLEKGLKDGRLDKLLEEMKYSLPNLFA